MTTNPLNQMAEYDQSIWLDYIKSDLISTGELKRLIAEDNLRGITSNPSLFEKAIADSNDYDDAILELGKKGLATENIYETLALQDVRNAADEFRNLYNKLDGADGFVSLEVNPHLAHDTQATIEEARRLWKALDRPNVFIKVPATKAGLPVITQLISEGINVNVTLLFSLDRYREVGQAYVEGLEKRIAEGYTVTHVASVASFFLSRIDGTIDSLLEKASKENAKAKELLGEVAIASAKCAYEIYNEIFESERFKKLAAKGAKTQRLLWASTSTKNPNYSDVKYVEALIGPQTVNTLPLETLNAYRDHGKPAARLTSNLAHAKEALQQLPNFNIDLAAITQALEDDGLDKFNKAYDQLIKTLGHKSSIITA